VSVGAPGRAAAVPDLPRVGEAGMLKASIYESGRRKR